MPIANPNSRSLTQARLQDILDFDPTTGVFRWRRTTHAVDAGQIAGFPHGRWGYWRIGIDGGRYMLHRIAWLYVHGVWPPAEIDHIDGVKSNNAIANLRSVTRGENMHNQRVAHRSNRSGLLGAHWRPEDGKWVAQISLGRRKIYLGIFDSGADAHAAYLAAKVKFHPTQTIVPTASAK